MRPVDPQIVEKLLNLLDVHASFLNRGIGNSVSLDLLCFFGVMSRNLSHFGYETDKAGTHALDAIQSAAENAYYKKKMELDLSTGQKKAISALASVFRAQIVGKPTIHIYEAYQHAQKCVKDMNRAGGVAASFGEMPDWDGHFTTYEAFYDVMKIAKEELEKQTDNRYKINQFSLEYDESATQKAKEEKTMMDLKLFMPDVVVDPVIDKTVAKVQKQRAQAVDRICRVLENVPLFFTTKSIVPFLNDYKTGYGFVQSANRQGGLISPSGVMYLNSIEYVNHMHADYPAWVEQQEAKKPRSKRKSTEARL